MVIKRRRSIDPSQVEDCLKQYFNLNPAIVKRRWHYPLIKVLDFMRNELGLQSISDLLKCDAKQLALALQAWVAKRVGEASIKTIRFEVYLARSFFAFYDVEIPLRKIKIPRKAGRTRIDRLPSLADLQRLVSGAKSPRMRLAIMMMALTGMRLNECLNIRREHIDLERGFITIPPENTKTGRGREVPIPSELKEELKQYLEKHFPFERGFLFCVKGNPEKRIHVARFYDKYIKLLRRLGLDEKTPDGSAYRLHPHVFRKWYRTQLEAAGVNKLLIDLWLGHNSGIEKLYYLPPPEVIKQEFDKADRVLRIFGRPAEPLQAEEYQEQIRLLWSALLDIATAVEKENPRLLKKLENLGAHYARTATPEGLFATMLLKRNLLRHQP
ncbi:MAG: tyrosine-type recombinase/integrase [archaeon YNP-WB-062]|jgi:integrase/recombinase XerD|nr:tyrosine-type recombinase/integrase [Candidatus Culexarchaeum yellowstonense]